jgi:hypothetical protein
MSASKIFLKLVLILGLSGFSLTSLSANQNFHSFSINYVSWVELLDLELGLARADGFAQFFGNSISYEYESYKSNWGHSLQATGMTGMANGGETGLALSYQQSNIKWSGASASVKYGYRPSGFTAFLLGPIALVRQISWPDQASVSAKSGHTSNVGAVFAMKIRPAYNWEINQELGTLFIKSATYWSVGLGYKF